MNILLLSLAYPSKKENRNLYSDLVDEFIEQGHRVKVICPFERRNKEHRQITHDDNLTVLRIKTLNVTATSNFIEKGIGLIVFPYQVIHAVKKHFDKSDFDLIIYSTPPITFARAIQYLKIKYKAITYLMLKDIFPHNAVDLGIIKKNSLIFKYFRNVETKLYEISDVIGCLSPANITFMKKQNPKIEFSKYEEFPNSLKIIEKEYSSEDKIRIRNKLKIPFDKIVLIYGGNLGAPQGIDFLLKIIKSTKNMGNFHIVIAGKGTEYNSLYNYISDEKVKHVSILPFLTVEDYNQLVSASDLGLILLDKKFTMPNFPSRLLPYLNAKIPVLSATDTTTDIGKILEENNCGFNLVHGNIETFLEKLNLLVSNSELRSTMGENSKKLLVYKYTTKKSFEIIMKHFKNV